MSTRVDKGGPKFKPILKSKARPSATPVPQDARTRHSVEHHASMPPPSVIPEREPSTAPSTISAPTGIPPSAPQVQSSKPSSLGTPLVLPSARPATIQPMRAAPTPPSRGIPIAPSRSTPAPPPSLAPTITPDAASTPASLPPSNSVPTPTSASSSKGRKRAAPETEDTTEEERPEPTQPDDARGGIARKRPKLSIVQAEEDRVKNPKRRAKRKKTSAAPGTESGTEGGGGTSGTEVSKKKRRVPRKKKLVDENVNDNTTGEPSRPKRTRTKKKPTQETHDDADADAQDTDPQSESDSPAKKKRKKRQKSAATAEPEGTPDPIDPTQVTMGAICDDPGSGRMSSRWETSQLQHAEAKKRAREERDRAAAEAAEEERETGRTGARKGASRPTLPSQSEEGAGETVMENNGGDPDEFTYNESLKASHYAPQVRIGANGEIVLDMESLQVDRAADPEIAEDAYSFVEESDQSKFTNSNSWSKRKSVRWAKEDTAMFYDALRQFGQNFDLIARVLPGRTYRMCKNKFKAEDKKNPGLIDDALKNGVAVDIETLSRMTGKNFSGPTPVIEAKKALDLREPDAPVERAPDQETSSNVPTDNQPSGAEHGHAGDGEAELATRQPASPSPTDPLLDNSNATARSPSPPPIEDILDAIKSFPPSAGPSVTVSSGPVTISAPTRAAVPIIPSSMAAQTRITVEPPALSAKKKGKKKAVQEEGVEVLGLLGDDLHDLYD